MTDEKSDDGSRSRYRLLQCLSPGDLAALRTHIQRVTLVLEQTLHEPGELIDHVYFVEEGIVSITADTRDSGSVEIGLIGIEGGGRRLRSIQPDATAIHRAIVQVAGSATRMRTTSYRETLGDIASMQGPQPSLRSFSDGASLSDRPLQRAPRARGTAGPLVADGLGPRAGRSGVSVVANALQSAGAIRRARGRITLLDRATLEAEACSCYRLIEDARLSILGRDD